MSYLAVLLAFLALVLPVEAAQPTINRITAAELWKRLEFRLEGLPASINPYDPARIQVDGVFTLPSGRTQTVPAFWYQPYTRNQSSNGSEYLTSSGAAEWRLRYLPSEVGAYTLALKVLTNGVSAGLISETNFSVAAAPAPTRAGIVTIATNRQFLATSDGQPLPLIGANVCWHGSRGTYDYNDWFPAMANAEENFARLWMWPHAFGIEADPGTLTNYRQESAWKLDLVFRLAESHGIYLMLCLDYHGMFELDPDYWGGNNMWLKNPYNVANGGPCANPNGFFTNQTAQVTYQKRLRYLIGRYGYSPNLLAWEFFNELDNVYEHLKWTDVVTWHRAMGRYMRTNDPYGHLVTTSLTGSSDRADVWQLPEMDFAQFHSYNGNDPAKYLTDTAQSFLTRYRKPVLIGEYGMDFRGWKREADPYLRGWRQGLWGGALGGSAGSGMSWWWESIHRDNVYPYYKSMATLLKPTSWSREPFTNINFRSSGPPPAKVGPLVPGGTPFNAHLQLGTGWGDKPRGELAIPNPLAAGSSANYLNAFLHGQGHNDLRRPFRLSAWLTNSARLVMHVNSVSSGSSLIVRVDGAQIYRTNLPNLDNHWQVTNEYNIDLSVPLPAGLRTIEITNAGADWIYLDWVRVENVLPSLYEGNWEPQPAAIGQRGAREALLYVMHPEGVFPGGATNQLLSLATNKSLTLSNSPSGTYTVEWFDASTATRLTNGSAKAEGGLLTLPLPPFREDMFGLLYREPRLALKGWSTQGVELQADCESGGAYRLEASSNMSYWEPILSFTNGNSPALIYDTRPEAPARFYRLARP